MQQATGSLRQKDDGRFIECDNGYRVAGCWLVKEQIGDRLNRSQKQSFNFYLSKFGLEKSKLFNKAKIIPIKYLESMTIIMLCN
jgi:hypothetical protein